MASVQRPVVVIDSTAPAALFFKLLAALRIGSTAPPYLVVVVAISLSQLKRKTGPRLAWRSW